MIVKNNWQKDLIKFAAQVKRFKKIIVWGQLSKTGDSFRYVMNHFYTTLLKLEAPVIWVDDLIDNHYLVTEGDLVIAANIAGRNLPVKKSVFYCLHNFNRHVYQEADDDKTLVLQVYTNDAEVGTRKWDAVTRFDKKKRTLYQPWGTNLLPWEFLKPTYARHSPLVFWVGTLSPQSDTQGNYSTILELKSALTKNHLFFLSRRVSDPIQVRLIRWSRIAPAVAGQWQVDVNYLPCRMFKNISFGQLGITNVSRFKDLLGNSFLKGENITQLVDRALSLPEIEFKSQILAQQESISNQTYLHKLLNIFRGLEEISAH